MSTTAPAFLIRNRQGYYYSRATEKFTTDREHASHLNKHQAAKLLASHPDGTLTVTPVAGKPLVR